MLLCALNDLSLDEGTHAAVCVLGKNVWRFHVAWRVSQNESLICERSLNVILYPESFVDCEQARVLERSTGGAMTKQLLDFLP